MGEKKLIFFNFFEGGGYYDLPPLGAECQISDFFVLRPCAPRVTGFFSSHTKYASVCECMRVYASVYKMKK